MKNKDRLYIALYARGGAPKMAGKEDTYVRSPLPLPSLYLSVHAQSIQLTTPATTGPSTSTPNPPTKPPTKTPSPEITGTCYNTKETLSPTGIPQWHFQETSFPPGPSHAAILLVKVMVAKVNNTPRLQEILRKVPIRQGVEGWNCVGWVREALDVVRDGGVLGRSVMDWGSLVEGVMGYVGRKRGEGRFRGSEDFDRGVPTFDLVGGC